MKNSWTKDAPNLLVINGIFTALSVILIPIVLQDNGALKQNWIAPIFLLIFTFGLFALTAAKIAEAVEQNNLQKYVSYLLLYNLAVILLFVSIGLVIYYHYSPSNKVLICLISSITLVCLPWIRDFFWLLFTSKKDFDKYLSGLRGDTEPQTDYWIFSFTKLFGKIRGWDNGSRKKR
jgi:fumarate reductase subunit D